MKIEKTSYQNVKALSKKDLAYINLDTYLKPFFKYVPDLTSFGEVISDRKKHKVDRATLVEVLQEQYAGEEVSESTQSNIQALLSENTFTIITAHQPSLFTGPLYYIFKITSCLNLCKQLNKAYAEYTFVPLFINGSEDHDFDEIDHCYLDDKTIKWHKKSSGSVGDLTTEGLEDAIAEVKESLPPSDYADWLISQLTKAHKKAHNYDAFVLTFVNALFGKYGLVIASGNSKKLKTNFKNIIKKEIFEQPSQRLIEEAQNQLQSLDHKPQAHARAINFFYKTDGQRLRIEQIDSEFLLVNSDLKWSRSELELEIDQNPERFSPNVAMRPIFQEFTFPNLAYIGGGGELAYWLERKRQFEHFDVFYPMLIRRNSAMIVRQNLQKTMDKLALPLESYFEETHKVIYNFIDQNAEVSFDLSTEKEALKKLWKNIAAKAQKVDATLEATMLAKMTEQLKGIGYAETKMKKHLKAKDQINVNRIEKIRTALFPNDGLQERHDNFLTFFAEEGFDLLDFLVEHLDPMDRRFSVVRV